MKQRQPLIPAYAWKPLVFLVLFQLFVYSGTRLFTGGMYHHNWEAPWDLAVPFLPWTVLIYLGSYAFWVANVILSVRFDRERAYRFLCADFLSKLFSLLFFLCLPTTNTRPAIAGSGIWELSMKLVYALDTPDNLFPSLHCVLSWMCWLGVRDEKRIPKWYRVFSLVFTLMIFASTLTTKQHILIDVLAGWFIAQLSWQLAANPRITGTYRRLAEKFGS